MTHKVGIMEKIRESEDENERTIEMASDSMDDYIIDVESGNISEEMEKEWKEAFAMFDQKGDGFITFEELAKIMRVLGNNPTDDELSKMMVDIDIDQSGTIELKEFYKIMAKHWKDPEDEENELLEAFKVFDRDGDGFVVADEIKYVMGTLGQELSDIEIADIIHKADVDGDGKLNYQEFIKVMQKRLS